MLEQLSESDTIHIVHSVLLLALLSSSLLLHFKSKPGTTIKNISIWIVIILFIIILYSYRYEFDNIKNRVIAELFPSSPSTTNDGPININISSDGHYHIKTSINNETIKFMIDTGASDIVLSKSDAIKVGIDINKLRFTKKYYTANGISYGAPITIGQIKIGDLKLQDVPASVNSGDMNSSLLGMTFLNYFYEYNFKNDKLSLYP